MWWLWLKGLAVVCILAAVAAGGVLWWHPRPPAAPPAPVPAGTVTDLPDAKPFEVIQVLENLSKGDEAVGTRPAPVQSR